MLSLRPVVRLLAYCSLQTNRQKFTAVQFAQNYEVVKAPDGQGGDRFEYY